MGDNLTERSKDISQTSNLAELAQSFVINSLSRGLLHKARVDIFNGSNVKIDPRSGKEVKRLNEKELFQDNVEHITSVLVNDSKILLVTQENIDTVISKGYGDILFATVVTAKDPTSNFEFYLGHKSTPEEVTRKQKINFYARQEDTIRKIFDSLPSAGEKFYHTVFDEISQHGGVGAIVLLKKFVNQGYINLDESGSFFDDLYNGDRSIHNLVVACVNNGLVGNPEDGVSAEAYAERLTSEIKTINKQCEFPESLDRREYLLPVGSPEFVYTNQGVSQERLAEGLRFVIESGLTNTEFFTRICAGVNYSTLPSDLQAWFSRQGLAVLPCDLVFNQSTHLSHCHEVSNGMLTDLEARGVNFSNRYYRQPTFSTSYAVIEESTLYNNPPDNGADIAIGEVNPWWPTHSYVVSTKFIIGKDGAGGILVPYKNAGMSAVYVTRRGAIQTVLLESDQDTRIIGIRLPDIKSSYSKSIFQAYATYAGGKMIK